LANRHVAMMKSQDLRIESLEPRVLLATDVYLSETIQPFLPADDHVLNHALAAEDNNHQAQEFYLDFDGHRDAIFGGPVEVGADSVDLGDQDIRQNISLEVGSHDVPAFERPDSYPDDPAPLDSHLDIVFVDQSVNSYQSLIDGIVPSALGGQMTVVILDEAQDGVQQISDTLAQYAEDRVSAVHIVSHGDAGSVQLGNTTLDSNSLGAYQDELLGWGDALTEDGDLLFYGCSVGQGAVGQTFVNQLSNITGADIAASDNLTGNAALAGDWVFEVETGSIEAGLAFDAQTLDSFQSTLSTLVIDDSNADNNGTITEDERVEIGRAHV
jgi:hypothetical protein